MIATKKQAKKVKVCKTCTAFEYPLLDLHKKLHIAVIKITGRYPLTGNVINKVCTEMAYVEKGEGVLVVNGKRTTFSKGDILYIKPGESYHWDAKATLVMPCAPAWYPGQHRQIP